MSSIKQVEIEVLPTSEISVREGTSGNGKDYKYISQEMYASNLPQSVMPVRIEFPIEDKDKPYPTGKYHLADYLAVDHWGNLIISRSMKLIPIK